MKILLKNALRIPSGSRKAKGICRILVQLLMRMILATNGRIQNQRNSVTSPDNASLNHSSADYSFDGALALNIVTGLRILQQACDKAITAMNVTFLVQKVTLTAVLAQCIHVADLS